MPHSNSCSAGWFAARTMTVPIIKNMPRGFEESRGGDTEERRKGQVEKLMKNWPFEFINFSDPSLVLARAVQYRDDNETSREYFGLDGPSLFAIVDPVEKAVKEANPTAGPKEMNDKSDETQRPDPLRGGNDRNDKNDTVISA